jgi:RNA polymerase sigma factor FliA
MYTATGTLERSGYIKQYSPLVKRMAHQMLAKLPASVELDDMIQAGMIGLMDAMSRFEECQGTQFETFANQRIKGAMLDELRAGDWLPRSARKAQRDIESTIAKLEHKLGRTPSEAEIAKAMNLPIAEYQELLHDAKGTQLFYYDDFGGSEDDDDFLARHAGDDDDEPSALLQEKRFRGALIQAIEDLPEREKTLMGLYYEQDLNFREIAAVMGVTESRVCQLHSQAVARLRAKVKDFR